MLCFFKVWNQLWILNCVLVTVLFMHSKMCEGERGGIVLTWNSKKPQKFWEFDLLVMTLCVFWHMFHSNFLIFYTFLHIFLSFFLYIHHTRRKKANILYVFPYSFQFVFQLRQRLFIKHINYTRIFLASRTKFLTDFCNSFFQT